MLADTSTKANVAVGKERGRKRKTREDGKKGRWRKREGEQERSRGDCVIFYFNERLCWREEMRDGRIIGVVSWNCSAPRVSCAWWCARDRKCQDFLRSCLTTDDAPEDSLKIVKYTLRAKFNWRVNSREQDELDITETHLAKYFVLLKRDREGGQKRERGGGGQKKKIRFFFYIYFRRVLDTFLYTSFYNFRLH